MGGGGEMPSVSVLITRQQNKKTKVGLSVLTGAQIIQRENKKSQ